MAQTPKEYYSDPSNFGRYSFKTLKEIIDKLLFETIETGNYLSNTPRSRLLLKAKDGIRVLNKEIKRNILSIEITVGPKLYFPLPQDFIDWRSVYSVDDSFKLIKLNNNNNIQTGVGQLQDHNYEPLFDHNEEVLEANSSNAYNKPYEKDCPSNGIGEFKIDLEKGVIVFSKDLENKEIVLRYVSNGLQNERLKGTEILIHENLGDALCAYVFFQCIWFKRDIGMSTKKAAKDAYQSLLHKCKLDNLDFEISKIKQND